MAMERIAELELDRAIAERVAAGVPVLGVCLGFQLLFDSTTELGGAAGLGLVAGDVAGLDAPGLKVPHNGWEPVALAKGRRAHRRPRRTATPFYFVHSFAPAPARTRPTCSARPSTASAFACAVARGNVLGVQFHPEKSGPAGLRLLSNFLGVCARAPARHDEHSA